MYHHLKPFLTLYPNRPVRLTCTLDPLVEIVGGEKITAEYTSPYEVLSPNLQPNVQPI